MARLVCKDHTNLLVSRFNFWIMCHAHPFIYGCGHASVKWLYCPTSHLDPESGRTEACSNTVYSKEERTLTTCPYTFCLYALLKGNAWTCCICRYPKNEGSYCSGIIVSSYAIFTPHGKQEQKWQTCGHGYCRKCSQQCMTRHIPLVGNLLIKIVFLVSPSSLTPEPLQREETEAKVHERPKGKKRKQSPGSPSRAKKRGQNRGQPSQERQRKVKPPGPV